MRDAYEDLILDAVLPAMTVAQPGLLRSGSYYVAETAEKIIVGCGGWTKERPGSGEILEGVGHIRHFGVHPECTRHGVGQAIYARCRGDAKAAGLTKFECYSSLNGEAFYAALGFEQLKKMDVEMLNGITFPSVHMVTTI
jgi:N-acetylglutamate synthase-like GNAT family acetyltransferase